MLLGTITSAKDDIEILLEKKTLSIKSMTISDGLIHNNINDLIQDSYGFLWIVGLGGIQKYDGYTFKSYYPEASDFQWAEGRELYEDKNKQLWVILNEEVIRYEREKDQFVSYSFAGPGNAPEAYHVRAMAEDPEGTLWFWVHSEGLYRWNPDSEQFIPQSRINKWYLDNPEILVSSMEYDEMGRLWIGTRFHGLFSVDPGSGVSKNYFTEPLPVNSYSHQFSKSLKTGDGIIWFGSQRGLIRLDPLSESFEHYYINPLQPGSIQNSVYNLALDSAGNILTISNSYQGFGYLNTLTKKYHHYSGGIKGWSSSIIQDRSGIIWIGNFYQGLYKLDPDKNKFNSFTIVDEVGDILKNKTILAVCRDHEGKIWIGGDMDGLYHLDRELDVYRKFMLHRSEQDSLTSNFVLTIFQDSRERLWVGTQSGLIQVDPQSGRSRHVIEGSSRHSGSGRTGGIHEDESGLLWIVTFNGSVISFDAESGKSDQYNAMKGKVSFRTSCLDQEGNIWLGTLNKGLYYFDRSEQGFRKIDEVGNINISNIYLDKDGTLWGGGNGSGLFNYSPETDKLSFITEKDGLLSNGIMGLEGDSSGGLWLSSHRGLSHFDPSDSSFRNFFREDGFLSSEFTYKASFKSRDGEIILGSLHGVVSFYPEQIQSSDFIPPLVLTDLNIDNAPHIPAEDALGNFHISVAEKLVLRHDQNDLSISFSSLDFSHPSRINYRFFLENMELDWRPPGTKNTAYYTNLNPGKYVFHVTGTNGDGVWNEAETKLHIHILPPWWKTPWAYIVYSLLSVFILYMLREFELNRQHLKHQWDIKRLETEKLKEIDQVKSRFFANISHEFRTPITLILGPVQQLLGAARSHKNREKLTGIQRNAQRLNELIEQLLDLSKLDARHMKLKAWETDVVGKMKEMVAMFSSLAELRKIELIFRTGEDRLFLWIDNDMFEKIMYNLLGNAIKFTPIGGRIDVYLGRSAKGAVQIMISDSGPGIPEEDKGNVFDRFYQSESAYASNGTGIGLSLTKELIELHSGKIRVESQEGEGCTFIIELPEGKAHLSGEEIAPVKPESTLSAPPHAEITGEAEGEDQADHRGNLILVVDDSIEIRAYIRDILDGRFRILEARNGVEGVEVAVSRFPDMIISDVMMPEMDGVKFCRMVKNDERTSHIPVILLTAKAGDEHKMEGLKTGADAYLTKPFDKQELNIRIRNLISQRLILQEKFKSKAIVQPGDIRVLSSNDRLLQRVVDAVEKHLDNPEFSASLLASEVGASRMLLHNKIKALTGQTTSEFIRTMRLKRAAQLLQQNSGNISEIAYEVGFQSLSYFTRTFRKYFGKTPSSYLRDGLND